MQVALYTYARFIDIEKAMKSLFSSQKTYTPWLMTNTKLTFDAINYAKCMNIRVTGWSYPKKDSLQDMVTRSGLHPVTVIDFLPNEKIQALLNRDIVSCARLLLAIENQSVNDILTTSEINQIHEKSQLICSKNG